MSKRAFCLYACMFPQRALPTNKKKRVARPKKKKKKQKKLFFKFERLSYWLFVYTSRLYLTLRKCL